MITVDMLTHSFRRNMHEATLLTSDLDFKPLVDALVQDGMYVSLWYPKGKTNYELVDSADSRQPITIHKVQQWLTDTSREQLKTPSCDKHNFTELDSSWQHLETIEKTTYKVFFYKKADNYSALIQKNNDNFLCKYDNLEQLKFYVQHIYSPDVMR